LDITQKFDGIAEAEKAVVTKIEGDKDASYKNDYIWNRCRHG
jgi:hypothetical protein